jgi:hypothetical protein
VHEPLRGIDAWLDQFRRSWMSHLDTLATELARGKHDRRHISAVRREVGGRVLRPERQ